ncbi:MAG: helix-turn-helix transcriptional regulator, partial [Clostridia bacterium]|nr:helix-turn-helix transcriptional regulator [Clostridia bacterium]
MENNELITNALRYINDECKNSELTIEDIAVNAGFCTDYFNRIFLNHTGFNVMEYVRFTRLSYAATELRRTDKSILDIGLKYGYDSHDGFTRAFKKQYGKTPSEYREEMKNIPVTFADYNMNATSGNRVTHSLSEFKQIPSDIVIDYLLKLDAKKFGYDALSIKWNGTSILTDCDFEENGCFIGADMFFEEKPYLYLHVRHKEDIARYVKTLVKLKPSVIQLSVEEEICEQEIKDCLSDVKYNNLKSLPQTMYFGEPFEISE